jgi:uncharacterized delta-60 repeat protein
VPVSAFGGNGHEIVNFGGFGENAFGVALQPDGKVVMVGTTETVTDSYFTVARLEPTTGALDTTFNPGAVGPLLPGEKTVNFSAFQPDQGFDVAVQADGKIVVAGQSLTTGIPQAAAARLNSDGSLDASFGAGGLKSVDFGGNPGSANRVLIQPTGQIVLIGSNSSDTVVARLLEN